MGSGIAQTFATHGYQVRLLDVDLEYVKRGLERIRKDLARALEKGKITRDALEGIMNRIAAATSIDEIGKDCDFVIEAVNEDMALKKAVFKELDERTRPDSILATNTSSLSITEIASATKRSSQVVGMHFFNPAPVMKLVEVVRGKLTSQETVDRTKALATSLDKTCIESAETPGFVVNRLLMTYINEAIHCLAARVATARDIDTAAKLGLNHPMGPIELADFVGLDTVVAILDYMTQKTGNEKYRAAPLLRQKVESGQLGRKTGGGFYEYSK